MPVVLQYESVNKFYRSWWGRRTAIALQEFSLSVQAGEIFGFLGPNGAGKSTAIHVALGFTRPNSGTGSMLGHRFGHVGTRRRVGFLAENVALYDRPAAAAIRFYGGLNGLPSPALSQAVREVLQSVDLQAEAHRKVGQFSRGMLQRMGLAQALVNDPELLILDEPTSALDPAGRVAVRELLLRARERGKTIFLSSHLLSEVELVCDRVAMLSRGRVVRTGRLRDLLEASNQVEIVCRNIPSTLFPAITVDGKLLRLALPKEQGRRAIEMIWAAGGEIVSVNPSRRSLEDVFLELTAPAASIAGKVNSA